MSDIRPDLTKLVRPPNAAPQTTKRRATWLLPAAILAGFALLFLLLFRDRLIPATTVEVAPALGLAAATTTAASAPGGPAVPAAATPAAASAPGRLLFQASGWIEPDPLPVRVTALVDGFIDQVHVLEGQTVKQGEMIATLIDSDIRLIHDAAAAEVAMREADVAALGSTAKATQHRLDAEHAALEAAQADASEAADRLRRIDRATSGAVPESERISAQLENSRRQAGVRARQALVGEATEDLQRITHETASMSARLGAAKVALAQAALNLERTRITAPFSGRILRLLAAPGQKKMAGMDDIDSATVAILYDPAKLQARVDVPLADAAGLHVGQAASILCNLLPDHTFAGVVTRINGEADLQRNTLQAKVRLIDPGDQLRPEMLCRSAFFDTPAAATPGAPAVASASGSLAVYVPDDAINDSSVWVCDPESTRVSRRAIVASSEIREGYRRLDSGVRPGEWIVKNPASLSEGQRVRPLEVSAAANPQ